MTRLQAGIESDQDAPANREALAVAASSYDVVVVGAGGSNNPLDAAL